MSFVPDPGRTQGGSMPLSVRLEREIAGRLQLSGGDQSLRWIPAALAASERLIRENQIRFVISTYPPLVTHLTALILKRRHGDRLKWIADFRDPLSGNAASLEKAPLLTKLVERQIFKAADCLIANTDTAADRWRSVYPDYRGKIAHIWNGFDPEEQILPAATPRPGYRGIAHVGEVYAGRDPSLLLSSIVRLLAAGRVDPSSFSVHFIGPVDRSLTPNIGVLDALVQRGCAVLEPQVASPSDAARVMAEADSLLLVDWARGSSGFQVPAKLFIYVRVGRPILAITSKGSPVDRILDGSGINHVCLYPDEPEEETDSKVLRFLAMPSDAQKASEWFYQEFDGRKQVEVLSKILTRLNSAQTPQSL